MKKLIFLVAVATAMVSCKKPLDFYQGNTRTFVYYPTNLTPSLLSVSGTTATVRLNNNTTFNIEVMTPQKTDGQCFLLEAPFIPGQWTWDQNSSQYKAEDMIWNSAYGFSAVTASSYFVARPPGSATYYLYKGGVWGMQPSPTGWINSFNSPGTMSNRNFPVMGVSKMAINGQNVAYVCSY